jgi:hypothetical protein
MRKGASGDIRMYGILATCIAIMALFLGLFAISVPPEGEMRGVAQTAQIQTVDGQPVASK